MKETITADVLLEWHRKVSIKSSWTMNAAGFALPEAPAGHQMAGRLSERPKSTLSFLSIFPPRLSFLTYFLSSRRALSALHLTLLLFLSFLSSLLYPIHSFFTLCPFPYTSFTPTTSSSLSFVLSLFFPLFLPRHFPSQTAFPSFSPCLLSLPSPLRPSPPLPCSPHPLPLPPHSP